MTNVGIFLPEIKVSAQAKPSSAYSDFGWFGFNCPEDDPNYVNTITADTAPDCDKTGPDCFWKGIHWMQLHKKMVEKYGKAQGDLKWSNAWSSCRGISGAFGHELSIANNDEVFKFYVMAQGLNKVNNDLKTIYGTAALQQAVVDTGAAAVQTVTNLAQTAASTTDSANTLAKWLPYLVVAALAVAAFIFYKIQTK